jgi:hypothetical protein
MIRGRGAEYEPRKDRNVLLKVVMRRERGGAKK